MQHRTDLAHVKRLHGLCFATLSFVAAQISDLRVDVTMGEDNEAREKKKTRHHNKNPGQRKTMKKRQAAATISKAERLESCKPLLEQCAETLKYIDERLNEVIDSVKQVSSTPRAETSDRGRKETATNLLGAEAC